MIDSLRLGAATGLRPIPAWKQGADFLLTQVTYSIEDLLQWRSSVEFDGPIYAGVMVLPSVNAHPIQQRAIVENDSTLVVGQSA
jgi:hypothetical protein